MPAKLIDERSRYEHQLAESGSRIGRKGDNDIALACGAISRYHARIRRENEAWVLEDLGSSHGTFVNGTKAEGPVTLKDGDRVALAVTRHAPNGEYGFVFRDDQGRPSLAQRLRTTLKTLLQRKDVGGGQILLEPGGDRLVVRLVGVFSKPEVDALAETLRRQLEERPRPTALDLGGVTSMNAYALTVVEEVAAWLKARGQPFRVFGAAGTLRKLVLGLGAGSPVAVCGTEEEALRGTQGAAGPDAAGEGDLPEVP